MRRCLCRCGRYRYRSLKKSSRKFGPGSLEPLIHPRGIYFLMERAISGICGVRSASILLFLTNAHGHAAASVWRHSCQREVQLCTHQLPPQHTHTFLTMHAPEKGVKEGASTSTRRHLTCRRTFFLQLTKTYHQPAREVHTPWLFNSAWNIRDFMASQTYGHI